jgi:hypothetical protein
VKDHRNRDLESVSIKIIMFLSPKRRLTHPAYPRQAHSRPHSRLTGAGYPHHVDLLSARHIPNIRYSRSPFGPSTDAAQAPLSTVGVGIRFKPTFRFGYFGGKKIRFWQMKNRSVGRKIKNRLIRFRFFRFGFQCIPNSTEV